MGRQGLCRGERPAIPAPCDPLLAAEPRSNPVLRSFRASIGPSRGDSRDHGARNRLIACWLIAMVLVAIYSGFLMLRESRSEGTPFPPKGLKKVLRACWVPMLIGGIVGTVLVISLTPAVGAAFWAACFGVALLATRGSAPRVISRLGWLILPSGLRAVAYSWSDGMHPLPLLGVPEHLESPMLEADLIMGVCFGLIPLVTGYF